MQKMDNAGKNSGAPPSKAAVQIAGVPLSRWKLLMGESAQEKKIRQDAHQASAHRMPRREMERMLNAFGPALVGDDSRKLRKEIFLFVKHNQRRLHPADALELLLKVVVEDDAWEKYDGQHELRGQAISLAGKLERKGRFEGMEKKGEVAMVFAPGQPAGARAEYRNTPYTHFLIKCIASQTQASPDNPGAAVKEKAEYEIKCMPAVESAIRSGVEGMQENARVPLLRLRRAIAGEISLSALAAGFAIKIIADAMSGAYSIGGFIATALLGTLALLCRFGIKKLHNSAQYALEILDVAKLGGLLARHRIAERDEKGRCI